MKAILVSLGLIIVTSLASRITPTHADDFKEGIEASLERREPIFKGS